MDENISHIKSTPNPFLKLAVDLGPLIVFFFANAQWGIMAATAAFMVAIVLSFFCSYWIERRIPILPLVTAVIVLIFGGLTIVLNDAVFIKVKPTIINCLFGTILLTGLFFRRLFLEMLFGSAFKLTEQGWRILTIRWACFFFLLAVLNEIVWRSVSTDMWVNFKVFGIMPLTIVFSLFQMRVVNRFRAVD